MKMEFKASSGNRARIRIIIAGMRGHSVAVGWIDDPSESDRREFDAWYIAETGIDIAQSRIDLAGDPRSLDDMMAFARSGTIPSDN